MFSGIRVEKQNRFSRHTVVADILHLILQSDKWMGVQRQRTCTTSAVAERLSASAELHERIQDLKGSNPQWAQQATEVEEEDANLVMWGPSSLPFLIPSSHFLKQRPESLKDNQRKPVHVINHGKRCLVLPLSWSGFALLGQADCIGAAYGGEGWEKIHANLLVVEEWYQIYMGLGVLTLWVVLYM